MPEIPSLSPFRLPRLPHRSEVGVGFAPLRPIGSLLIPKCADFACFARRASFLLRTLFVLEVDGFVLSGMEAENCAKGGREVPASAFRALAVRGPPVFVELARDYFHKVPQIPGTLECCRTLRQLTIHLLINHPCLHREPPKMPLRTFIYCSGITLQAPNCMFCPMIPKPGLPIGPQSILWSGSQQMF